MNNMLLKAVNPMIVLILLFFTMFTWCRSVSNSFLFFIERVCDTCQEELSMVLEKVSWNNSGASTIAYFLWSNVFETPMASLSSVGKSHYEVQQSFSFPSSLLYWALARNQRCCGLRVSSWAQKLKRSLHAPVSTSQNEKKEDSKQLGPFFESDKHKH